MFYLIKAFYSECMKHLYYLNIFFLFAFTPISFSHAEGTAQLRPTENSYGNLHLNNDATINGTNERMYTNFAMFGAAESEQIKIRISSTDETIFFGMNNKEANGGTAYIPNVPYRILDPLGNIVLDNVTMPAPGDEGYIATWNQAVAGPSELGVPGGYDAIRFEPAMVGDYVIEFDPDQPMDIHLFDVTVASPAMEAIPGRLHCQSWQISTENGSNAFLGHVFPYDPRGVIYEVDFNGMQPFTFGVNFNSTGTGSTGNYLSDRQSKRGRRNLAIPEFKVFLSPPDENEFPSFEQTGNFSGLVEMGSCEDRTYCLNYSSDVPGILDGFIDINNNTIYDEGLDILFGQEFLSDTTVCIPWDSRDATGQLVDFEEIQVVANFGLSVTHLPIFDAEHNTEGLKVRIVSPASLPAPELYWDDREINDNNNLDDIVNLRGCQSELNGCHRWEDRGNNNNPETINTWWYTKVLFDTLKISPFFNPPVSLSFSESGISSKDTSICLGDSISLYIINEGDHYDNSLFDYIWKYNGQDLGASERFQKTVVTQDGYFSISASLRSDSTCFSQDSLRVLTESPVSINAVLTDEDCEGNMGAIEVSLLSGPPDTEFFWADFPFEKSGSLASINAGSYQLVLVDSSYSANCALDTTFEILPANPVKIQDLILSNTYCYEAKGKAEVIMPEAVPYSYSWSSSASTINIAGGLSAGPNQITVTDPVTGCKDDSVFTINSIPFEIEINKIDEMCRDASGSVSISIPESLFTIYWNGTIENTLTQNGLSEGIQQIKVVSDFDPTCLVDTSVIIENMERLVAFEQIETQNSACFDPSGSINIIMADASLNYEYNLNNQGYITQNFYSSLPAGSYHLLVKEAGTNCSKDTILTLNAEKLNIEPDITPEICASSNGSIDLNISGTDAGIFWSDGSQIPVKSNLPEGNYSVSISKPGFPDCRLDTILSVLSVSYDINADFDFYSLSGKNEAGAIIKFNDKTAGNIHFSTWNFGDMAGSSGLAAEHIYQNAGQYTILHEVKDQNGCSDSISKVIDISEFIPCKLVIPNAFSPNQDQYNDEIGVIGYAESMDLRIFNRWGEVIFRSEEITKKWDGTYLETESPIGVYPFVLEYACRNESGRMIKNQEVGQITLVR